MSEAAQQKKEKSGAPGNSKVAASSAIRKRTAKKGKQESSIVRKIRALRSIVDITGQFVPCRETAPFPNEADLRLDSYLLEHPRSRYRHSRR